MRSRVSFTPDGTSSVAVVPGEVAGPLLRTTPVTVTDLSTWICSADSGAVIDRSTVARQLGSFCRPGSRSLSEVTSRVAGSRIDRCSGALLSLLSRRDRTSRSPSGDQVASRGW
ncbi:hypothetical protein QFW96_25310 [Saccharopolyspora sp. TS4A08]|uniref:Uncharacterized protein n=1 Tax=Saccharopolyspora ipomoeae TaxID=3042027 RepID=A0ABT6PVC8_9PSEU|nr:hypothetical protein [Saccharopolyspora sp. TS4A08]MDI2031966.1 hypothetical protein [Saccharopolyspora sp. TS4A08]